MDLILFGIQGSGKGTQAKLLAQEFGFDIFEAGGSLRSISITETELGQTVKSYIDNGHLVPHEIIMRVVKEAIFARPHSEIILFDGIPRDENQKKDFDQIMSEADRDFLCIHLLVDEELAVKRILGRAQEESRADDSDEAIIRKRMDTFKKKTLPVIASYKEQGKVIELDGGRPPEEVFSDIKKVLDTKMTNTDDN